MKKLALSLLVSITAMPSVFFAFAANGSVQVSAIVGSINHAPVITSVIPASNPRFLGVKEIQNYTLYFRDDEKDSVSYTITPVDGYTNPVSGTVNPGNYDSASGAYVTFIYLAPASAPTINPTAVTVTLNDSSNLVNKDIHLYIH